jgi:hypothetical protein
MGCKLSAESERRSCGRKRNQGKDGRNLTKRRRWYFKTENTLLVYWLED